MVSLLLAIIYLSFISLGLPDSVLGSAWPSMYGELGVPISFAGIISMIVAVGTVVSSLASDYLTKKLGAGCVTAISVGMTALSLLGFSLSNSFWMLCLIAIPYGLGAGSVDAALNNYVALHFASRHMSWLHCMWGIGTIIGPNIMGYALTTGKGWASGYRYVSSIQIILTLVLIISLPIWKSKTGSPEIEKGKPISPFKAMKIKGAKEIMVAFFCYCALESTAMLWAASYMNLHNGISAEKSASLASIFFIGITFGRFLNGFLTYKFNDTQMIRIGQTLIMLGAGLLILPFGWVTGLIGFIFIGLGCAPIYPSIIHSTPIHFGQDKSQAMIGIQMASAYTGSCLMPTLFGLIANHINVNLLPLFLALLNIAMIISYGVLFGKIKK